MAVAKVSKNTFLVTYELLNVIEKLRSKDFQVFLKPSGIPDPNFYHKEYKGANHRPLIMINLYRDKERGFHTSYICGGRFIHIQLLRDNSNIVRINETSLFFRDVLAKYQVAKCGFLCHAEDTDLGSTIHIDDLVNFLLYLDGIAAKTASEAYKILRDDMDKAVANVVSKQQETD